MKYFSILLAIVLVIPDLMAQDVEEDVRLNATWLGDPLPKKWVMQIDGMLNAEMEFYKELGLEESFDITIHAFKDREEGYVCMEEKYGVNGKWRSESGIPMAGIYVPSQNLIGIFGFSRDSGHQLTTIYHEISHGFVDQLLPVRRKPMWLNEGLAEYFQGSYIKKDGEFVHEVGTYEKGTLQTKFMLGEIQVKEFLDYGRKDFMDMEYNDDRSAYRLAHAIVTFMIEKAPEGYFKEFFSIMKDPSVKDAPSSIVDGTYPGGIKAFEKEFRTFVLD